MALRLATRSRWSSLLRVRFNSSSAAAAPTPEPAPAAAASEKQKPGDNRRAATFLTGATVATMAMIGVLHARRLYEEKQTEAARLKGIEPEFVPDKKSSFLQLLPLRSISRVWGSAMALRLPVWSRPAVYKSWARAFHTDLEEVPLPLKEYASLSEFFSREMKEGARPVDAGENCLVSPVDGVVMRFGRVIQPGATVEQVKGFTYSLSALLGSEPVVEKPVESKEPEKKPAPRNPLAFWRAQPAEVPVKAPSPPRELYYCVLYLGPGDYHRVHAPSNWSITAGTHFPGNLLPVNARATRTIPNLYVVNERVVLRGSWREGYLAVVLVGATGTGSIKLKFQPELITNTAAKEKEPAELTGQYCVAKGDEFATFNMGSTVVLVFEAPGGIDDPFKVLDDPYQGFQFTVKKGQRIKLGQALGEF